MLYLLFNSGQSTSVLKWACHAHHKAYKDRLAYGVTVRILA